MAVVFFFQEEEIKRFPRMHPSIGKGRKGVFFAYFFTFKNCKKMLRLMLQSGHYFLILFQNSKSAAYKRGLRVNHTITHNQHNQAQSYTIAQSHNQIANFCTIAQSKCKFLHNRTIKMQVFAKSHNQYQNGENIPTISRRYCTINKEILKTLLQQPTL